MFRKLVISVGILLVSGMVLAEDGVVHAVEYTNETFPIELAKKDHFVMFYMPWCRHSRILFPTWEQLAERMHGIDGSPVRIAKVDCETAGTICEQNNVFRWPTLKFFKPSWKTGLKYEDQDRDLESLMRFINSTETAVLPPVSTTPITIEDNE